MPKRERGRANRGPTATPDAGRRATAVPRPAFARRFLAGAFIVAYLAATGWFLLLHALGDSAWHPAGYLWTWDMFPSYDCWSRRRSVVGETFSGRYVQLLPGPNERFRYGVRGDLTRFDILPTVQVEPYSGMLLQGVNRTLERTRDQQEDDPVAHIYILEQYWPSHFNLPDDLYRASRGEPNPRRRYWRMAGDADVGDDGRLVVSEQVEVR